MLSVVIARFPTSRGTPLLSLGMFSFQAQKTIENAKKRVKKADKKHGFTKKMKAKATSMRAAVKKVHIVVYYIIAYFHCFCPQGATYINACEN